MLYILAAAAAAIVVVVVLFTVVFPWVDTLLDDPAVETEGP